MIKLDVRLSAVYDMVEPCDIFVDIGSDHGYLPLVLMNDNVIKSAIVCDINEGPLDNARKNFKKYEMKGNYDFCLSDGFVMVPEEMIRKKAVGSICGMGGELMVNILETSLLKVRKFDSLVLQPMNSVDILRKWLHENGFTIICENMVRDGHHFYNILKVININDDKKYDDISYELGDYMINNRNQVFEEYLNKLLKKNKEIVSNCKNQTSEGARAALKNSSKMIEELERIKEM